MKQAMDKDDALAKLMKFTKVLKKEKVRVAPQGPATAANKWRCQDPKFASNPQKSSDLVQAGGMEVDPARKEEYENWRKDKLEEENYRRAQAKRKANAARARADPPVPPHCPPPDA